MLNRAVVNFADDVDAGLRYVGTLAETAGKLDEVVVRALEGNAAHEALDKG